MSDKDKRIKKTFDRVIPKLSEVEKDRLMAFGHGIETVIDYRKENGNGKVHSNNR